MAGVDCRLPGLSCPSACYALQDAGRAFVDGYRGGLEKAKEDTLLEDLADKLWRQTAPSKEPGHGAEATTSSPQPPQRAPMAGAAALTHPADAQPGAVATPQPANTVDVTPTKPAPSAAHQQRSSAVAPDDVHDPADQQRRRQQQTWHSIQHLRQGTGLGAAASSSATRAMIRLWPDSWSRL